VNFSINHYFLCILFQSANLAAQSADRVALKELNSRQVDFSPTISADGNIIIFESNRTGRAWLLYQSEKQSDGTWSEPVALDDINQHCDFLAGPNLSHDGNTLYYTAFIEGVSKTEDIFYSVRTSTGWGGPIRIGSPISTEDLYEGFPSVSPDENQMYFIRVSDRHEIENPNVESCFHIFLSTKGESGQWTEPVRLPDFINSGCVRDPRIMIDHSTLMFSALDPTHKKGHFDLFETRRDKNGNWVDPIRLDYVNTDGNELSPTMTARGDILFFQSDDDLYQVEIPDEYRLPMNGLIYGVIRDSEGEVLDGLITVRDKNHLSEISNIHSNTVNGYYNIVLRKGGDYAIEFHKEGYSSEHIEYDLRNLEEYFETEVDVVLKKISLASSPETPITTSTAAKVEYTFSIFDHTHRTVLFSQIMLNRSDGNEIMEVKPGEVVSLSKGHEYSVNVSTNEGVYFGKKISAQSSGKERINVFGISAEKQVQLDSLIFDTNSSELNYATHQLMLVVDLLAYNPDLRVEIYGHTDDVGNQESNRDLSKRRSDAVRQFMISNRIPADRIQTKELGESSPLVPNTSTSNRAKNRRVEIFLR